MNSLRKVKEEQLKRLYRNDPCFYAENVLGVQWWRRQQDIANALVQHKRVIVKASHSIGKTHIAGGLVNWFYDVHDPSITLTTAPTQAQVDDLLWKEIRGQRRNRPGLLPKASRLESAPNHFAAGYTANDASSFQGRHEERVLIIFDEATGIDGQFWEAAEGMLTGEESYMLAILNPTDTASRAYLEEQSGGWHVMTVSALDHPNIAAELAGQPAPFPAAVRLAWVAERVKKWCERIIESERTAHDIEWPPESGNWHRPGPLFEGRVLGRWPRQGSTSVWSDAMWSACLIPQNIGLHPLEIGCDVARFGDDFTSIVARRGNCVVWHETHNGWATNQTAKRLRELAGELIYPGEAASDVELKVDDDGVGGGVTDQLNGWKVVPVGAGSQAMESEDYPNRRSELWFTTANRANHGHLDLTRLSEDSRNLIRGQVMAPTWKMDGQGRRVVEPKDQTKKRIKRSPDDADSLNLAFAPNGRRLETDNNFHTAFFNR